NAIIIKNTKGTKNKSPNLYFPTFSKQANSHSPSSSFFLLLSLSLLYIFYSSSLFPPQHHNFSINGFSITFYFSNANFFQKQVF
ncbi:hypothetical protein Csa_023794, partial [Cucumis sativus]